mmetsp:Transcript_44963/g.104007  ORF Transcript_44963/g.104007 Transcript_44963/m.104007 type:complete len:1031 (-) Transcript_44963:112-3204(-)
MTVDDAAIAVATESGVSSGWLTRMAMVKSNNSIRTTMVTKFKATQRQTMETVAQQLENERLLAAEADRQKVSRSRACARLVIESMAFIFFTSVLTVWALIGDDVRLTTTEKPADIAFNVVTVICMCVFSVEIVLSCLGKPDYFLGFFFILDVVSTLTMLLDITYINDALLTESDDDVDNLKASKTTKLGARAARIVRVLRLVRLVKLYKNIYEARMKQQRARAREMRQQDPGEDWDDDDDDEDGIMGGHLANMTQESTVGRKLSEMTIRRVVILVLSVMMVLPLLSADETGMYPFSPTYGADVVHRSFASYSATLSAASEARYNDDLLRYIYTHNWFTGRQSGCPGDGDVACPEDYLSHLFWFGFGTTVSSIPQPQVDIAQLDATSVLQWQEKVVNEGDMLFQYGPIPEVVQARLSQRWERVCETDTARLQGVSLLSQEIADVVDFKVECPDDLRKMERRKYTPTLLTDDAYRELHFAFYFDLRPAIKEEAVYNLLITIFICLLLCCSAAAFSHDANKLVLKPLESMMVKVKIIRVNPLLAAKLADQEFKEEEKRKAKMVSKPLTPKDKLLRIVGFGPASEVAQPMETTILEKTIIKLGTLLSLGLGEAGTNIIAHNMQAETGFVDGMLQGERIECVIGYARISNFSTMTEVLQIKTVTFVNQVAEIVHGCVHQFHGAPNKNNGDTFLLIWRRIDANASMKSRLADMALYAFAKILGAVHTSPILAKYRTHPGLQQRLGRKCRVDLTFGLHEGWAIEGALGTEYKIDASYLSPHVSIAEQIERATATYGVNILATEAFHAVCTWEMSQKLRLIDCVVVRGQPSAMKLYVLDLCTDELTVSKQRAWKWTIRQRFRVRQFLDGEKAQRWSSSVPMIAFFDADPEVRTMRSMYTPELKYRFNMGYQNYIQGEWEAAQQFLSSLRVKLRIEDGPTAALLRFMEASNNVAPLDWPGYHLLFQVFYGLGSSSRRPSYALSAGPRRSHAAIHNVWATKTRSPSADSPREPTKQVHIVSFDLAPELPDGHNNRPPLSS